MNISSTSSTTQYTMKAMQRPDASKIAEQVFSKLDTKGQGYLEKSDLQTALGKLTQISSSSSASSTDSSTAADALFSKLDTDGDSKVTQAELSASLEKMSAQMDGPFPRMRMHGGQGGMPPPPPAGGQDDKGLSKDELVATSTALSETDSGKSKLMSELASNFDAADTNGDGKVTASEAMAYAQSKDNASTDSSTNNNDTSASSSKATDSKLMRQMMQLVKAYGGLDQNAGYNSFSAAA